MDRVARQLALPLLAAIVGDQRQADAARGELAGQGLGRKDMAAGAAGGENDGLGAHVASPMPARSRVSASSMPTAMATAIAEEPP